MTPLPTTECWNTIGVRGDRSCPELKTYVHCQNCPVFAKAGRQFLNAPTPSGYLEEWTERLAPPSENIADDLEGVLVFRLADEWLALSVQALVEVTTPRTVHRIPFRGGLLAGIVNIRGELVLCMSTEKLLGVNTRNGDAGSGSGSYRTPTGKRAGAGSDPRQSTGRLLVIKRDAERWALPVDEVEKVIRVPRAGISPPPTTVGRATARLSRGVFPWEDRAVGLLDEGRLFEALRAKLR